MQTLSAPAAHGKCRDASMTAFSLHSSARVYVCEESKMWKIAAAALRQGNRVAKSKNLMAKPACLSRPWLRRPPSTFKGKLANMNLGPMRQVRRNQGSPEVTPYTQMCTFPIPTAGSCIKSSSQLVITLAHIPLH